MTNSPKVFDLEERTAKFGEDVIKFCRDLPKDEITRPHYQSDCKVRYINRPNYCEADDAESKQDFKHKIGICKKESRETKHFLRMTAIAVPSMKDRARKLWSEAKELNLIFNSIYRKLT